MTWSFADLIGQDETISRLRREAETGKLAHAYLFEGPTGCGKTTLAKGLAAFLFCETKKDGDACGGCRPCRLLAHGEHPDYLELPRASDDPYATDLKISRFLERPGKKEEVKHTPLLTFLRLKPVEGNHRVAVIPDADRMLQGAANALLKTLEEPPGNATLILTASSRDHLLATIVSRCRRIGLRPLAANVLTKEIARRKIAPDADAETLAFAAEGALGIAIGLADSDTFALWRWLDREAFATANPGAARELADRLTTYSAGADNTEKRKNALASLNLAALALRRRLRAGIAPDKTEAALAALWEAGEQIEKMVKPELVVLSAAFDAMSALRG